MKGTTPSDKKKVNVRTIVWPYVGADGVHGQQATNNMSGEGPYTYSYSDTKVASYAGASDFISDVKNSFVLSRSLS